MFSLSEKLFCEENSIDISKRLRKFIERDLEFWRIKKLELIVILEPDMESDPRISVMFTVDAILFVYFLFLYIIFLNSSKLKSHIYHR